MQRSRTHLAATTIVAVLAAILALSSGPLAAATQARSSGSTAGQTTTGTHGVIQARAHASSHHRADAAPHDLGGAGASGAVLSATPRLEGGHRSYRFATQHAVARTRPDTTTAGRAPPV
ncbi:MAG: hypothetical protein ACRDO8_02355 [Nocardioidaceae bacterium]